ncbi:MAG: aminoacyl--tRNA ligase-related protein [Candidatus Paceibacterota bacterium]
MLQSKLFPRTAKEAPKDEISANAMLLARAGFTDKLMAGVYTYLPLGLRALKKIENIIREEMNKAGGQEILMPALQPKENWIKTDRWDSLDSLFRFTSHYSKIEFALGPTHEEIVSPLAGKFSLSYKNLPFSLFQIQTKFRDEKRAKSGILRGREFVMKDLYSFHADEKDLENYYEKMKTHYKNIFDKCGIGDKTHLTFASGGTFSKYSHEFQMLSEAGEDAIFLCEKCKIAINKEIFNEQSVCPTCGGKNFREEKAIEVGNIFKLMTKYSDPFGLKFTDKDGNQNNVIMGCYGMGLTRLLGAIAELNHDDKGIIWPESVAPFAVHLLNLKPQISNLKSYADKLYADLQKTGVEVLYDDREDITAGEKFADADLIGIPYRVVVSEKTIKEDMVELKKRGEQKVKLITRKKFFALFA